MNLQVSFDYVEPTLPPSLPNLKIIPFLPTDAVKKTEAASKFEYYKPTSYPIITEAYDPSLFGHVQELDVHSSVKLFDPTLNYPVSHDTFLTESDSFLPESHHTENYAEEDIKEKSNIRFNNKYINDKLTDPDFEGENGAITSNDKFTIQSDLKKFMQNSYATGFDKFGANYHTYSDSYDKFNMYPESVPGFNSKMDYNTDSPLFTFDENAKIGFSPPTKTEGEFLNILNLYFFN